MAPAPLAIRTAPRTTPPPAPPAPRPRAPPPRRFHHPGNLVPGDERRFRGIGVDPLPGQHVRKIHPGPVHPDPDLPLPRLPEGNFPASEKRRGGGPPEFRRPHHSLSP